MYVLQDEGFEPLVAQVVQCFGAVVRLVEWDGEYQVIVGISSFAGSLSCIRRRCRLLCHPLICIQSSLIIIQESLDYVGSRW